MIEEYSPKVQEFIKNIGLYVFTKYFNNLSESEILQKCSNNSVEDIVQNYEEQLSYLKITNSETIQEIKNNSQQILNYKQQTIEDLQTKIDQMKCSESEIVGSRISENNKFHESEKKHLMEKISFLEQQQSVKNLIEERFCDKKDFNNPTEQGDYAEKILDDIINNGLPFDDKAKIQDTSDYGGSGDRIITFSNTLRLMIEVKNKDPVKKSDIDEFERHYEKDFKENKNDMALFLSYRTTQIPQKCKAIIPTFQENGKVVYFGMDSTLDKEQKKQKIINTLEEIFRVFERDKMNLQNEKESEKEKSNVYNMFLKELRDNLSSTEKSLKESKANTSSLEQRRINIVKQLNDIYRIIHKENIDVDKSLIDSNLYKEEIVKRVREWLSTADDNKKKDWKKNMKKEIKDAWSEYDIGVLTRLKRSDIDLSI